MGCSTSVNVEQVAQRARAGTEDIARQATAIAKDVKDKALASTVDLRSQITQQMDSALASAENGKINAVLDSAIAAKMLDSQYAPASVRKAAEQVASRQLQESIASQDAKRIKGALIAAQRLNAAHLPEFAQAAKAYQSVKKLPPGWDVSNMALSRQGDKMVAKAKITDPVAIARFQRLLDLTHRKVYTRDRLGEAVPERLQLESVSVVTNDDLWANYMARREWVRIETESSPAELYPVETTATIDPSADAGGGEPAELIAAALAADFEALMPEVNETFLWHGTSAQAAESITTSDFQVNLAGTNAGTLYGRGVYFAENASKSDEYTKPDTHNLRYLLLCRTILGRVKYIGTTETDPRACEEACIKGSFHSILGDRKKARGTFREFIVFDEDQVYPNFILAYKRVNPTTTPSAAQTVQVMVPAGVKPGDVVQAVTPSGTTIQVQVPPGFGPGQVFTAQY